MVVVSREGLMKGKEESGEKNLEEFARPDGRIGNIADRKRANASS